MSSGVVVGSDGLPRFARVWLTPEGQGTSLRSGFLAGPRRRGCPAV